MKRGGDLLPSLPEIYGIILAGGQSKRMGFSKLLLPYRGKPLLSHVLRTVMQAGFTGVLVAVPREDQKLQRILSGNPCQTVLLEDPQKGMGYSLASAVRSLPATAKAVVVLLADQPGIHLSDLQYIIKQFIGVFIHQKTKIPIIIRTKYRDGEEGHPVLFTDHFFSQLIELQGDVGGREIIRRNHAHVRFHLSPSRFPQDVDTPADYQQLVSNNQEDRNHE